MIVMMFVVGRNNDSEMAMSITGGDGFQCFCLIVMNIIITIIIRNLHVVVRRGATPSAPACHAWLIAATNTLVNNTTTQIIIIIMVTVNWSSSCGFNGGNRKPSMPVTIAKTKDKSKKTCSDTDNDSCCFFR